MSLSTIILKTGVVSNSAPTDSSTPVYSPASTDPKKAAIVQSMRFTNRAGSMAKLRAWFLAKDETFSSNARRILPYDIPLPPGSTLIDDGELTLGSGDRVYLQCNLASSVHFVFSGVERDIA